MAISREKPAVTRLVEPVDTCAAQAHGYARGCSCQRRGWYLLANGRAYCAQHAAALLQRPLTVDEKAPAPLPSRRKP
jgi:hypothetical protein